MREMIEKNLAISLTDLTLREQIQLCSLLASPDRQTVSRTFITTKKFGSSAARSFLSCEYGDEFRGVVLSIGEKLPEKLARQIIHGRTA